MNHYFLYNPRLGISVPDLKIDWESFSRSEQERILFQWEQIREGIPDRIMSLEKTIIEKQHLLDHEEDFRVSCLLNAEITELASIINDLHLWYRIDQSIHVDKSHD